MDPLDQDSQDFFYGPQDPLDFVQLSGKRKEPEPEGSERAASPEPKRPKGGELMTMDDLDQWMDEHAGDVITPRLVELVHSHIENSNDGYPLQGPHIKFVLHEEPEEINDELVRAMADPHLPNWKRPDLFNFRDFERFTERALSMGMEVQPALQAIANYVSCFFVMTDQSQFYVKTSLDGRVRMRAIPKARVLALKTSKSRGLVKVPNWKRDLHDNAKIRDNMDSEIYVSYIYLLCEFGTPVEEITWVPEGIRPDFKPVYLPPSNTFNSWAGYRFRQEEVMTDDWSPAKAKESLRLLQPLMNHMHYVMSRGNIVITTALVTWIALKFHQPDYLDETILLTLGKGGTGKGLFCRVIKEMFGHELLGEIQNPTSLSSRFLDRAANKLYMYMSEVAKMGPTQVATLKYRSSARSVEHEEKFVQGAKEVVHFTHYICSSNDYFVNALSRDSGYQGERRLFPLPLSYANYPEDRSVVNMDAEDRKKARRSTMEIHIQGLVALIESREMMRLAASFFAHVDPRHVKAWIDSPSPIPSVVARTVGYEAYQLAIAENPVFKHLDSMRVSQSNTGNLSGWESVQSVKEAMTLMAKTTSQTVIQTQFLNIILQFFKVEDNYIFWGMYKEFCQAILSHFNMAAFRSPPSPPSYFGTDFLLGLLEDMDPLEVYNQMLQSTHYVPCLNGSYSLAPFVKEGNWSLERAEIKGADLVMDSAFQECRLLTITRDTAKEFKWRVVSRDPHRIPMHHNKACTNCNVKGKKYFTLNPGFFKELRFYCFECYSAEQRPDWIIPSTFKCYACEERKRYDEMDYVEPTILHGRCLACKVVPKKKD